MEHEFVGGHAKFAGRSLEFPPRGVAWKLNFDCSIRFVCFVHFSSRCPVLFAFALLAFVAPVKKANKAAHAAVVLGVINKLVV